MKKYILFHILLLSFFLSTAQNKITGYQYAFNHGDMLTFVPVTPTSDFHLQTDIDISSLTNTVNQFHIRFVDESGLWSGIVSHLFIKQPDIAGQDRNITGYEYWFNNDTVHKNYVSVSPQDDFNLITDLNISTLTTAVNTLHIRFQDSSGQWSATLNYLFIKQPDIAEQDRNITGYEYWFNDDTVHKNYVSVSPQDDLNLITDLNISTLTTAVNTLHISFQDSSGQWSPIVNQMFLINSQINQLHDNLITGYEYWFDNDRANLIQIRVDSAQAYLYVGGLDMNHIWRGTHVLHTRYLDRYGQYSLVTTDTITKISNPLALFNVDKSSICQGEDIQFTDNGSIDYDIVQWDFGDGSSTNEINVVHTYEQAGTYTARLTVTDTIINKSNSLETEITVNVWPDNTINISTDLPLTLTANQSGAVYQWYDCSTNEAIPGETSQSFVPQSDGSYSVEISMNTCTVYSTCQTVTLTAIYDSFMDQYIKIYPNPLKNLLKIENNLSEIYVEVFDLQGILIKHTKSNKNYIIMDLSSLKAGIYIVKISAQDQLLKNRKAIYKIIKE